MDLVKIVSARRSHSWPREYWLPADSTLRFTAYIGSLLYGQQFWLSAGFDGDYQSNRQLVLYFK